MAVSGRHAERGAEGGGGGNPGRRSAGEASVAAIELVVDEDRCCPHCGTPGAMANGEWQGAGDAAPRLFAVNSAIIRNSRAVGRSPSGMAAQVILLVAAAKAIESFGDVIAGLLQKHERLDQVAISFVLKGLVGGLSFAIIFIAMRSLPLAVLALAAGLLLVFCAYEVPDRTAAAVRTCARVVALQPRPPEKVILITHHPQPIPDVEQLFEISVLRFLREDHFARSPSPSRMPEWPTLSKSMRAGPELPIHKHLGS